MCLSELKGRLQDEGKSRPRTASELLRLSKHSVSRILGGKINKVYIIFCIIF